MQIAICDDENADYLLLQDLIIKYFSSKDISINIDGFFCGEDFLKCSSQYNIVLMDICLSGISGIETIKKMENNKCHVIFTSSSREFAVEAFSLNATHYLVKPVTQENVFEALDRCFLDEIAKVKQIIQVKPYHSAVQIPILISDIIYIEVFNKISIIHTDSNHIRTCTSLDALLEQLDDTCFIRAQRSYIVNMNYIEAFFTNRIVMQNGVEIIISRNNKTELSNQYQNFLFEHAQQN